MPRLASIGTTITAAAMLLVGCASAPEPPTSTPTRTTQALAATASTAPNQPPNNRKPVEFDPCTEIGDQPVVALGFDPTTRHRTDFISDHYAFLGCSFYRKQMIRRTNSDVGRLTVSATNITLDEMRARGYRDARPTTVAGRQGLAYRTIDTDSCAIAVTGPPESVIDVLVDGTVEWVGCPHVEEAARTIIEALPK